MNKSARVFVHPAVISHPGRMEMFAQTLERHGIVLGTNYDGGAGVGPAHGHKAHELMRSITMTPEGNFCMINMRHDCTIYNPVSQAVTPHSLTAEPTEAA